MKRKKHLSLIIPEAMYNHISAIARRQGVSRSSVVKNQIDLFLKGDEK